MGFRLNKTLYITLFFIILLLAHPIYLKQNIYKWLHESICVNNYALVQIFNADKNSIKLNPNDDNINISFTDYCNHESVKNCALIKLPVSKKWVKYDISYKITDTAESKIYLMGPLQEEDNVNFPVLVDYKDLIINEKDIKIKENSFWYQYNFATSVNNIDKNEIIEFSVLTRQHHFKISDFLIIYKTFHKWEFSSYWSFLATVLVVFTFALFIYLKKLKHLFCFVTFLLLLLPLIYTSKQNLSRQENRSYSKFPSILSEDRKINENFGIEFNNWFSDRFGGREALINARFLILYKISVTLFRGNLLFLYVEVECFWNNNKFCEMLTLCIS